MSKKNKKNKEDKGQLNQHKDLFFVKQLQTLDKYTFSFVELNKIWKCDLYNKDPFQLLQRFLLLNHHALDFLNIKADIEVIGNAPYLSFYTSQYAGSIPILSPKNGKPCGDLCVGGRYGEDVSELLSVIGQTLLPEYDDTMPPLSSSLLKPPLYFECCNFIDKWSEVEKAKWHKFDVIEQIQNLPSSGTRWDVYALKSFNARNTLRFPNRNNMLNSLHKEFRQLIYVLYLCFNEINKPQTPIRSRMAYFNKISRLQAKYNKNLSLKTPEEFVIHAADPFAVKEAKQIANIILNNKRTNKSAWRINYSEFFERYVQYIFGEVARNTTAKAFKNPHFSVSGKRPKWALQYLEPDLIIQKEEEQFVVDAKYKSHIFNWNDYSDELRDTFRHDFHQILAYCSFNSMQTKNAMLVYPFNDFVYHRIKINSPLALNDAFVYFVGIPLEKNKIEDVKEGLNQIIRFSIK